MSGVPQGSVLGPILFLVYINGLEEGVTGKILKFADDTKLFRKVKESGDKQNLQDDLDKLVKLSEQWQMLFSFGKCKCLHTGSGNTGMNYEMGGTILSKTVKEKYFGVTMNARRRRRRRRMLLFDPVIWIRRPTLRLDKKSLSCGPPVHYNFKNNMKINIRLSLNTNYIQ